LPTVFVILFFFLSKFLYTILWSQSLLNGRQPSHDLLTNGLPFSYSTYRSEIDSVSGEEFLIQAFFFQRRKIMNFHSPFKSGMKPLFCDADCG